MGLELELVSAEDLKDVNLISTMDVYAVVSLCDVGPCYVNGQRFKTAVVRNCSTRPEFNNNNNKMSFSFKDDEIDSLFLEFKLVSKRTVLRDKNIGKVHVSVKELYNSGVKKSDNVAQYEVKRPSGKNKGRLSFSFEFVDDVIIMPPRSSSTSSPNPRKNNMHENKKKENKSGDCCRSYFDCCCGPTHSHYCIYVYHDDDDDDDECCDCDDCCCDDCDVISCLCGVCFD